MQIDHFGVGNRRKTNRAHFTMCWAMEESKFSSICEDCENGSDFTSVCYWHKHCILPPKATSFHVDKKYVENVDLPKRTS